MLLHSLLRWNSFVQPGAIVAWIERGFVEDGSATGGARMESRRRDLCNKLRSPATAASPLFVVPTLANPSRYALSSDRFVPFRIPRFFPRPLPLFPSSPRFTPRIQRRCSYLSRDNYRGGQVDSIQSVSRRDSFRFEDCEVAWSTRSTRLWGHCSARKLVFQGKNGVEEKSEERRTRGRKGGGWDLNDTVSSRHPCFLVFRVDETDDN